MKLFYSILTLILLITSSCQKSNDEPLAIVKKIFAKGYILDLEKHFVENHIDQGHPNGADFPNSITKHFVLLKSLNPMDTTAVVNITFTDTTEQSFDAYVHLVKDSVWKVSAYRYLMTFGIVSREKEWLENMNKTQIDSIIEFSNKDTELRDLSFKSMEEYDFQLGNARLTLSSDNDLITYFKKNKDKFEQLKDDFIVQCAKKDKRIDELENSKGLRTQMNNLLIRNAETHSSIENEHDSFYNLKFKIGGLDVNTVGYMYIDPMFQIPEMSPDQIIMIRKIEDNWFLYKTT